MATYIFSIALCTYLDPLILLRISGLFVSIWCMVKSSSITAPTTTPPSSRITSESAVNAPPEVLFLTVVLSL